MLETVHRTGTSVKSLIARARDKSDPFRLYGFGHRVYKTYDPRARVAKRVCTEVISRGAKHDPLLEYALELEEAALADSYFQDRHLYPNVDFYTGLAYRAMGIPSNMFTVLFAIGRLPGWIAQWLEQQSSNENRIVRPRQIYVGPGLRTVAETYASAPYKKQGAPAPKE